MDRCHHDRCVQAHPHVWVTMKTELAYAPDGSVTAVQHAWTFDDMYSAFATEESRHVPTANSRSQSCNRSRGSTSTRSRNTPISPTLKSMGGHKKMLSGIPQIIGSSTILQATVLTLHFTLPFKQPVKARRLTVEIYDPEFFIDFGFAERNPVRLFGAPAQCTVTDEKPSDGFFSPTLKLNNVHDIRSQHRNGHEFCQ
jgi:ABC-type uncharacterized transport system substrate-binding protein